LGDPFTIAFTRLTLGFHVRPERRWEWDTCPPKTTSLPQISHFAIYDAPPSKRLIFKQQQNIWYQIYTVIASAFYGFSEETEKTALLVI
jgi:hypothetical protein